MYRGSRGKRALKIEYSFSSLGAGTPVINNCECSFSSLGAGTVSSGYRPAVTATFSRKASQVGKLVSWGAPVTGSPKRRISGWYHHAVLSHLTSILPNSILFGVDCFPDLFVGYPLFRLQLVFLPRRNTAETYRFAQT